MSALCATDDKRLLSFQLDLHCKPELTAEFTAWKSKKTTVSVRVNVVRPPSPLLAVPNVSTASVPISVLLYSGPLRCGLTCR